MHLYRVFMEDFFLGVINIESWDGIRRFRTTKNVNLTELDIANVDDENKVVNVYFDYKFLKYVNL